MNLLRMMAKSQTDSLSRGRKEFGFVFWGEGCGLGQKLGEGCLVEWWRRGGAGGYRDADFAEEIFLAGGGADAEQAGGRR